MKDLKYLSAYLVPFTAIVAIYSSGWLSYATVIFVFGLVPLLDLSFPNSTKNLEPRVKDARLKNKLFDIMLYANVPIVYGIIFLFLERAKYYPLSPMEELGLILSVGLVIGACGINVGHELGHRTKPYERALAKMLLLPALYMHFYIEHNRGHHRNVATDLDPASAKRGEIVYTFWLKSLIGGYINAWKLERKRLERKGVSFWSLDNQMFQFHLIQAGYLVVIWVFWSFEGMALACWIALVGILLLETINYIEHYGLRRNKLESGRYERVQPHHSWNANFELGRILLYELTRHSDHHYLASKKYQVLDHHYKAPQLPMGYPSAMVLSMFPPLWFSRIHPLLNEIKAHQEVMEPSN